jgi:serine/threonine-protein kinase
VIDERFVLPDTVVVFPVEQLASSVQARLTTRAGQYAVTNPGGRSTTMLLSAEAAELVEHFREPTSVAAAIMGFSQARHVDPHLVLGDAFPTLRQLVNSGFLVAADASGDAHRGVPDRVADFTVTETVQSLPDVAVVRGRSEAGKEVAIKLLRDPRNGTGRAALQREAAVLERAAGCRVPSLVHDGSAHNEAFLALGWVDGTLVTDHAGARRRPWDPDWRHTALELACGLLEAYAGLHARGVIHADVHPKNVLVSPDGGVTLIDFGLARVPGDPRLARVSRGGVLPYSEPEWALARLRGQPPPPATVLGEQHAVAALLYQLFTGRHYVESVAGMGDLLVSIAGDDPRPFSEHGLPPWPAVEAVLGRMLAKEPAERFDSVSEAADALRGATASTSASERRRAGGGPGLGTLLQATTERLSREGGLIDRGLPAAPRVSVNYGAAGVAYFFYRLALASGDARDLATAVRWLGWARRQGGDALAFHDRELGIRPSSVGHVSIYHSAAGTACVEALVANAMGDARRAERATTAFATGSRLPCASVDLTVGRSSTLVGATLLWEALRGTEIAERCGLLRLGDETLVAIFGELTGDIADAGVLRLRGIAHGWAGVLYAALRWCEATAARVPDVVGDRIDELATLARTVDGHVSWRGPHDMPMAGGWCHGPAGYAHLWSAAARVLGDDAHAERALQAAHASWVNRERVATLCCGLAGQAYAMLVAHRISGEARWVARAHELAARATREAGTRWCLPNSLWKGDVGIASVIADLERPERSCMPLFGHEGWPAPAREGEPRVVDGLP